MKISIVVPCYNEQEVISIFYNELMTYVKEYDYELIFINDGSKDKTLEVIKSINDKNVKWYNFSRNFGKEAAIYAGLQKATGDLVCIMDADLQDPPCLLPKMIKKIDQGFDSVATYRQDRKGEPKIRSIFARGFYKLINKMIDVEIVDGARDYRLMRRHMVDAVLEVNEYNRFSKGIFAWVGFETYYLPFENVERAAGETSWSFWGLFKYALEGIVSFTTLPLKLAILVGLLTALLSVLMGTYFFFDKVINGNPTEGWTSLVVIMLFFFAVVIMFLGIIGEYLSKIYTEVKKRPVYVIKEEKE